MAVPENCWECSCSQGCRSRYGGTDCKHETEITRAAIARVIAKEEYCNDQDCE